MIIFGVTLMLSPDSPARASRWLERFPLIDRLRAALRGLGGKAAAFWVALFAWAAVLIATPIAVWQFGEQVFALMAALGTLAQLAATLSALALGWPGGRIVRALLVVLLFSWLIEWLGQVSGFPFGRYAYTAALQPQVAGVPSLIPLAWMMMLAPAWGVAEAILGRSRERLRGSYPFIFAALSGLIFTAWDLYLDPQMTARRLWVWQQPGGYFGIPWINYFGWWLSAALLTLAVRPSGLPQLPLFVIYTLTWAFQAVGLGVFWGQPGPAFFGFLGMGVYVVWAWQRQGVRWMCSSGPWWASLAAPSHSR
jgi:putative membrane protein